MNLRNLFLHQLSNQRFLKNNSGSGRQWHDSSQFRKITGFGTHGQIRFPKGSLFFNFLFSTIFLTILGLTESREAPSLVIKRPKQTQNPHLCVMPTPRSREYLAALLGDVARREDNFLYLLVMFSEYGPLFLPELLSALLILLDKYFRIMSLGSPQTDTLHS